MRKLGRIPFLRPSSAKTLNCSFDAPYRIVALEGSTDSFELALTSGRLLRRRRGVETDVNDKRWKCVGAICSLTSMGTLISNRDDYVVIIVLHFDEESGH